MRSIKHYCLLVLLLLLPMQSALFAQGKYSVDIRKESLKSVLTKIQSQGAVRFLYSNDDINPLNVENISVKDADIKDVLNLVLKGTGLTYQIGNDSVVTIKKAKQEPNRQQEKKTSQINGVVTDMKGEPLPGVSVLIKGTTKGIATDVDGKFELTSDLPQNILLFSFMGMKKIEVTYKGEQFLSIKMEEEASDVGEVIVTGFFDRKKEGFSGTVTQITRDDLKKVHTGNIFTTISTIDSGFKIEENNIQGSNPNAITEFTIRGKGSFQSGSTSPIFILDGFEVSVQKIFDLDINRIQSITLLKDASATILYGSKAANGVIVIETVAPAKGKLRVTYDFKPTFAFADLNGYDLMDAREKLQYELEAGLYEVEITPGYEEGDRLRQFQLNQAYYEKYRNVVEGVNTYWLSQPIRSSISHAHSIFVEGGNDNVRYGIDANYNLNTGVIKGSGRNRLGVGFSLIYRIKDKITIKNYASFSNTNPYNSPYGSYSTYARVNPYERIYDKNGMLIPKLSNGEPNPLYDAILPNKDYSEIQEFRNQLNMEWILPNGFRMRGQLGIMKGVESGHIYKSPFSAQYLTTTYNMETSMQEYLPIAKRGQLTKSNGQSLDVSGNITLNYNKLLKEKHLIYVGAGFEFIQSEQNNHSFTVTGFPDDKYSDPAFAIEYLEYSKPSSGESNTRSIGSFLTANYIFDNRFFADFSGRLDGSSRFGTDNKYAPFWSLGVGWNIHNEMFFKKSSKISMFKLRASYGVVGNQEFSAYQAKTTFAFNTDRVYNQFITANLLGYGNPDLKWQNQYQLNTGLDIGLLEDILRFQINYYHKKTEGMLTDITVAPSLGFNSNTYTSNLGTIQNDGVELNSNVILLRDLTRNIEWSVMLQASTNKNKLLKISNALKSINAINNADRTTPLAVYEEGESMSAIKAVKSLGIDPVTGKEIFVKKLTGAITYDWDAADKIVCGDSEPLVYGNFGSNLFYKGWNLNLQFRYRFGADYYNSTLAQRVEGANPSLNADRRVLNDRWKKEGQFALYKNIKEYTSTYISTRFVQKEHLLQLGSLSLSYDFSKKYLEKIKFNSLRASFYMNDIFRISTIKNERGLSYPFQLSYVFGLNLGF